MLTNHLKFHYMSAQVFTLNVTYTYICNHKYIHRLHNLNELGFSLTWPDWYLHQVCQQNSNIKIRLLLLVYRTNLSTCSMYMQYVITGEFPFDMRLISGLATVWVSCLAEWDYIYRQVANRSLVLQKLSGFSVLQCFILFQALITVTI